MRPRVVQARDFTVTIEMHADVGHDSAYAPDSPYAWKRLCAATLLGTIGSVGMWSFMVVLPTIQKEFGVTRAEVSLPFTLNMLGFAVGGIVVGKLADRF